jgi:hypothetical protein
MAEFTASMGMEKSSAHANAIRVLGGMLPPFLP